MSRKFMLSHSDMDGVGCSILMDKAIGGIETQYVGYQYLASKIDWLSKEDIDYLFVTDIHLTNDMLKTLISNKNFKKAIYIDHHEYEDKKETIDILENDGRFSYNIDTSDSATWLTHQMLSKKITFDPEFTKLAKLIDIYDSWKHNHKSFNTARDFDALFWHYGLKAFEERFKNGLYIDPIEIELMKKLRKDRTDYIEDSIKNYSQEVTSDVIFIYNSACKHISSFALDAPVYAYYIIMSNVKDDQITLSFRFHSSNDDTFQNLMSKIDKKLYVGAGGHKKSGSFHLKINMLEDFIEEIQRLNLINVL